MTSDNSQLREYLNHLIVERGLSAHTISAYRRDLEKFIALSGIQDLTSVLPDDVERFIVSMRTSDLAESSISRAVVAVRNAVAFTCKESGKTSGIHEIKPPKTKLRLPKSLTIDEVESLLRSTKSLQSSEGIRDTALLELLYGTGARISEVVALDLHDVLKFDGGEVSSIRLTGKGGKTRIVPVGRFAREALDQYLVRVRPGFAKGSASALFLNERGGRLTRQSMWSAVVAAAKRANLNIKVSPHSLRHSYATHLLDGGADVRIVQELLGHSSVTTTQIYTLVTIDKLRESYASAHPRAR
jgi:integrase/recombinase XerD